MCLVYKKTLCKMSVLDLLCVIVLIEACLLWNCEQKGKTSMWPQRMFTFDFDNHKKHPSNPPRDLNLSWTKISLLFSRVDEINESVIARKWALLSWYNTKRTRDLKITALKKNKIKNWDYGCFQLNNTECSSMMPSPYSQTLTLANVWRRFGRTSLHGSQNVKIDGGAGQRVTE